jgi:adenosyl cobinamide kinase/adenosyl cobinamide phosphate guanylyltransferase
MPSLFVIGGARSGKSRYAQQRAEDSGLARAMSPRPRPLTRK